MATRSTLRLKNRLPKKAKQQRPATPNHFLSDKVSHLTESVIREMTRQAMLHNAVNLAQGFPDFSAPLEIKKAAQDAVAADVNQYAITWGAKSLRNAIARQMGVWQGITVDQLIATRGKSNPAGRVGDPEEFGLFCAFLCGAKAGFITGQNIVLDGGAFPGTL